MIDELWFGWRELWGAGQGSVEQEFFSMFKAVRSACEAASRRGAAALAQPEKLALGRLMQGMEKLAGGQSDEEDLQWCREAGNRVLRMIAAWDNVEESRSPAPAPQPQPDEDISGSIDEWFNQVSRFIPQAPENEPKTEIPASVEPPGYPGVELESNEPERDFLLERSSASLELSGQERIETAAPEAPEIEPEIRSSSAEPDDIVEPAVNDDAAVDDGALVQPEAAPAVEAVGEGSEDIVEEGASEGWLSDVYFSECCLEAAEAIRNNADRLEGTSAKRTARMLRDWVEYLLCLSADFGIVEADVALNALWSRLEELTAGGAGSRSGDAAKVEELLRALSSLERECGRVAVAVG